MDQHIDVLILIGRPASGKSEIVDFLSRLDASERARFHIAALDVLDDFPLLWAWFEEDDILVRMGRPRLHTDAEGYFLHHDLWHVLIERLDLDYRKRLREADYHAGHTTLVEFARGSEHGGYAAAFAHLSDDLLSHAGVIYVDVPFEESLRKNRRRFNPDRPDSILEHGLPDQKLRRLYGEDDWAAFSAEDPSHLLIRGLRVPYAVFPNHDDVTTGKPDLLRARLQETLDLLRERCRQ